MKSIYVSHPFTGKEEENRKEARQITTTLVKAYPEYLFINPLDMLIPYEQAGLDYENTLKIALQLASSCWGIIMTGKWARSKGCKAELAQAYDTGGLQHIFLSYEDFYNYQKAKRFVQGQRFKR